MLKSTCLPAAKPKEDQALLNCCLKEGKSNSTKTMAKRKDIMLMITDSPMNWVIN